MKYRNTSGEVVSRLFNTTSFGIIVLTLLFLIVPAESRAARCQGDLSARIECLNNKLRYVSMETDSGGKPLFKISGANVRILPQWGNDGTGNLMVGSQHNWEESTSGFIAGYTNTAIGIGATITGGRSSTAEGDAVTVCGGWHNGEEEAQGYPSASATGGGYENSAKGQFDVVIGGYGNISSIGNHSVIVGGEGNTSDGYGTTIIGGRGNYVDQAFSLVIGGELNSATAYASAVAGGNVVNAAGSYATAIGGNSNSVSGYLAVVVGGLTAYANGAYGTNIGGDVCGASGYYATVCGGHHSNPTGQYATVSGGYHVDAKGSYASSTGGQWWGSEWEDSYTSIEYAFTAGSTVCDSKIHWIP